MPSFDVVSEVDLQEVRNAVDQAARELRTRFDFKGVDASFEYADGRILLAAMEEFQLGQMLDILKDKLNRRGVDVRVVIPLVTDRGPITRNNALAANAMLEHGVRVFIYPGMSHVKAAVFDGWACLGSANWDRWSLSINNELNLATSHPPAVQELLDQEVDRKKNQLVLFILESKKVKLCL